MSENREKKEKMTAEARAAAAERLEEALGALPPRYFDAVFGAEAAAEEKKSAKKARKRTAPAWLRPVAACLAVLILGGLVVFSIPVVNNILTHRAPAELPGTDVAEADSKEEQTEKKEETEAPVETEVPVETEENEVSLLDKKISGRIVIYDDDNVDLVKEIKYVEGSFLDVINDERKNGVAYATDAEKVVVGMTFDELLKTMGCPSAQNMWALDDGRILSYIRDIDLGFTIYEKLGLLDENHKLTIKSIDDLPPEKRPTQEQYDAIIASSEVVEVTIFENEGMWNNIVEGQVSRIARLDYENNATSKWEK